MTTKLPARHGMSPDLVQIVDDVARDIVSQMSPLEIGLTVYPHATPVKLRHVPVGVMDDHLTRYTKAELKRGQFFRVGESVRVLHGSQCQGETGIWWSQMTRSPPSILGSRPATSCCSRAGPSSEISMLEQFGRFSLCHNSCWEIGKKMKQKKPSWKDLKPIIEELSSKEIIGLIRDLYNFCPENKEFFHVRFLVQGHLSNSYLKPYKNRISIAVSPEEPWKDIPKLSDGRKAISDFKKVKGGLRDTLELMLYYVQCGNDFTLEFGDIDEPFYDSMESMFSGIVKKLIQQKDSALAEEFMPKLEAEFERVDGKMGWGYPDALGGWMEELYKTFRPA